MKQKKLTPLEVLQRQKADLQMKSNGLSDAIENRFNYLQQNFGVLLRNGMIESTLAKMPPQLQHLASRFFRKEQKTIAPDSPTNSIALGIAAGLAEIVPFFIPGKKGAVFSILLKQILKRIS